MRISTLHSPTVTITRFVHDYSLGTGPDEAILPIVFVVQSCGGIIMYLAYDGRPLHLVSVSYTPSF